jgi:4-amino-4-deoxy-L-arabinose transferase-like glycosyltransferase
LLIGLEVGFNSSGPATCNLQPATCNLQLATCNLQLATCNLQLATCNLLPYLRAVRRKLFILSLVLIPAALLTHLGIMVFIDDEAIRSLVAQEMLWSGNYVAPTMHGDAYLNKPPLWNWVLALSFTLHGEVSEWAARLPTVISLLGFAGTTYFFSRKYLPRYLAGLHALTVITCGRMLFWDSMLALIDVTFSWVVYAQIMVLYHFTAGRMAGLRGEASTLGTAESSTSATLPNWWLAFGLSYALTAVAFMLKGLPAIVFQGLTVFAILGWTRSWKQFLRPAHLLSGLACVGLLALYYWQYSQYVDLGQVAERIFVESGKRTAVAHGLMESVKHIAAFPFEMSYHFLPWTLLLVYLLQRGSWQRLRANDFAAFCLVAFLVNVPIYWFSPNVYPRYLLMLFPLLFGSLLFLHGEHKTTKTRSYRGLRYLLLGLMTLCAVVVPFAPLFPETEVVSYAWLKSITLGAAAGAIVWLAWRNDRNLLLLFAVFLLLLRIGFDFFVLPPRAAGDERGIAVKETAYAAMDNHKQDSVAIFGYTLIEPATGFYLTKARGYIVPRKWNDFEKETFYIVSPLQYPDIKVNATDSLFLRHLSRRYPEMDTRYPVGPLVNPPKAWINGGEELRDGMGSGLPME